MNKYCHLFTSITVCDNCRGSGTNGVIVRCAKVINEFLIEIMELQAQIIDMSRSDHISTSIISPFLCFVCVAWSLRTNSHSNNNDDKAFKSKQVEVD